MALAVHVVLLLLWLDNCPYEFAARRSHSFPIATVMHCGRCPRDVDEELPQGLSTINMRTSKEKTTRGRCGRASLACCLLFVVGCLLIVCFIAFVRVQWLLNYAVMQLSFVVVVVVLVIVLSTRITSNTNKNKYD